MLAGEEVSFLSTRICKAATLQTICPLISLVAIAPRDLEPAVREVPRGTGPVEETADLLEVPQKCRSAVPVEVGEGEGARIDCRLVYCDD